MSEQTIRDINERGDVVIDSEIREHLGLQDVDFTEKKVLVRLRDIQVVKVKHEEIDLGDLPNETGQTVSYINDRGVVRIDQEIRELLGINGRRAMLKISGIEVAKIMDREPSKLHSSVIPVDIAGFYTRTVVAWGQTKDAYLRAHRDIKYPLTWSTAMNIIGTGILVAMIGAVLLSQQSAFERLAAGNQIEWTGLTIALTCGVALLVQTLPGRKETVRSLLRRA